MADIEDQWPFGVVPSDDLVGRKAVVDEIVDQLLESGRSVILAAPRREGKSSVAAEALRRLREEHDCLTARLDFFEVTTERAAATELSRQLLASSRKFSSKMTRLAQAARGAPIPVPVFRREDLELSAGINEGPERSDHELLRDALALAEHLAVAEDRRCVLLLDEFQEFGKNCGTPVYGLLRAVFQQQRRTKQIFAGSQEHLLRQLFGGSAKAFLRYGREVSLPEVPIEAWAQYIVRKFGKAGMRCSPALARRIGEITGGHPADTMELCDQLSIAARRTGGRVLDESLLELALSETDRTLHLVFDQLWADLGEIAYARATLQRIVVGQALTTGHPPGQVHRALKALANRGLIRHEAHGRWSIRERLFQRYIAQTKRL